MLIQETLRPKLVWYLAKRRNLLHPLIQEVTARIFQHVFRPARTASCIAASEDAPRPRGHIDQRLRFLRLQHEINRRNIDASMWAEIVRIFCWQPSPCASIEALSKRDSRAIPPSAPKAIKARPIMPPTLIKLPPVYRNSCNAAAASTYVLAAVGELAAPKPSIFSHKEFEATPRSALKMRVRCSRSRKVESEIASVYRDFIAATAVQIRAQILRRL